jgi:hypothetical protein
MIVDGVWTLAVSLPPEIDSAAFVAATVAENVPWLAEPAGRAHSVLLPLGLDYTAEEQEQLILVAAKVLYYFRRDNQGAALAE